MKGKIQTCPECGAVFTGPWYKRFCSDACRIEYHLKRRKRAIKLLNRLENIKHDKETKR